VTATTADIFPKLSESLRVGLSASWLIRFSPSSIIRNRSRRHQHSREIHLTMLLCFVMSKVEEKWFSERFYNGSQKSEFGSAAKQLRYAACRLTTAHTMVANANKGARLLRD
jgi:hypothetical protein